MGGDHRIVETVDAGNPVAAPQHLGMHHDACADAERPGRVGVVCLLPFAHRDFGDESYGAEIDRQNRDVAGRKQPGTTEQGAVAAERNRQIDAVKLRTGNGSGAAHLRLHHLDLPAAEETAHVGDDLRACASPVEQHENAANRSRLPHTDSHRTTPEYSAATITAPPPALRQATAGWPAPVPPGWPARR